MFENPIENSRKYENSASTISAKLRGGRARQSAMAEASRPSTKNVSMKLPRMNAMTSCMEVSPGKAAAPATFACDDPHPIIGFAHLTKPERRSIRPAVERSRCGHCRGVVHSCTQGAAAVARRASETFPFLLRSFGAPRGEPHQDASLVFRDMTALASPYDRADGPHERPLRQEPPSPPSIG